MAFGWERFLRRHKVEYVTSGPNVAKGYVGVKCPFCGSADPSEHMSIDLRGRYWRCWRNSSHSGKSKAVLIRRLIRCTEEEAQRLAGEDVAPAPDNSELAGSLDKLRQSANLLAGSVEKAPLTFPREFHPLLNGRPMAGAFIAYLHDRGYRDGEVRWLAEMYGLHYATIGPFAWRLIIPIYDRGGKLLTWTGRAISANTQPRYKTLSVSNGPALASTSNTLLGLPLLWGAQDSRVLVICEGPFDALRLATSGVALGVHATCLFGLRASSDQRAIFQGLEERFARFYLLLDASAESQRLRLARQLLPVKLRALRLPSGVDDPGDLSAVEATELCLDLSVLGV